MALTEFEVMILGKIDDLVKEQKGLSLSIERIVGTCNSRSEIVESGKAGLVDLGKMKGKIQDHEKRLVDVEKSQKPWNNLRTFGTVGISLIIVIASIATSYFTIRNFTNNIIESVRAEMKMEEIKQ